MNNAHWTVSYLYAYSDAPKLESELHNAFDNKRINLMNSRKEFFHVRLDEIEKVVRENYDKLVNFTKVPPAEQYRESIKLLEHQKQQEQKIS